MSQHNYRKNQWPWLIRLCYWRREIDLGILGVWIVRSPIRFKWQTK